MPSCICHQPTHSTTSTLYSLLLSHINAERGKKSIVCVGPILVHPAAKALKAGDLPNLSEWLRALTRLGQDWENRIPHLTGRQLMSQRPRSSAAPAWLFSRHGLWQPQISASIMEKKWSCCCKLTPRLLGPCLPLQPTPQHGRQRKTSQCWETIC